MEHKKERKIDLLKRIADLERLNTQIEQDAFDRTNSCAKELEEMTARYEKLNSLYEQTLSELELAREQIMVINQSYQEKLDKIKASTSLVREALYLD
jgi:archaellum component FlaC